MGLVSPRCELIAEVRSHHMGWLERRCTQRRQLSLCPLMDVAVSRAKIEVTSGISEHDLALASSRPHHLLADTSGSRKQRRTAR